LAREASTPRGKTAFCGQAWRKRKLSKIDGVFAFFKPKPSLLAAPRSVADERRVRISLRQVALQDPSALPEEMLVISID
jgi:hypothetical protein